jgi:hypothetical protein
MTAAPLEPSALLPPGLAHGTRIEQLSLTGAGSCDLLLIPRPAGEEGGTVAGGAVEAALAWVCDGVDEHKRPPLRLPVQLQLYGVDLVWSPGRAAAVSAEERFETIITAVRDFTETEATLTAIEEGISAAWPHYEQDLPLAFGFSETTAALRDGLRDRYGRIMSLAGQLARISRRIHDPAPQPPTLAGQIGERLRERLRLADREEAADGCLEVLTSHYEACGQRASDFTISRRESLLSWTIIILLAVETILLAVDLLSSQAGS